MRTYFALLVFTLLMVTVDTYGQEDDKPAKVSPYDYISKYYNDDFRPFKKGTAYLGLAFSLQDKSLENTQRLLDKVVDGNTLNYQIETKGGYFIGDYIMTGLNFNFAYDKFTGVIVREGDTIKSESLRRVFTAIPVIKAYFPVTANQRLSFYTEIGIGFGGGNTLKRETKNIDEITKQYTSEFTFSAGFTPGVTFFAMENFAFEVGINVIGYTLERTETVINEVENAAELRHNVNLNINLLALKLGLAYYL